MQATICAELGEERTTFLPTDVTKRDDVKALVARAESVGKRGVDFLVRFAVLRGAPAGRG